MKSRTRTSFSLMVTGSFSSELTVTYFVTFLLLSILEYLLVVKYLFQALLLSLVRRHCLVPPHPDLKQIETNFGLGAILDNFTNSVIHNRICLVTTETNKGGWLDYPSRIWEIRTGSDTIRGLLMADFP